MDSGNSALVGYDKYTDTLVGFCFFRREGNGISVSSDGGFIIAPEHQGKGFGAKFMVHLAGLGNNVNITDIDPLDEGESEFLRSLGVHISVPKPVRITADWSLARHLKHLEDGRLLSGFGNTILAIFDRLPNVVTTCNQYLAMTLYQRILFFGTIAHIEVVEAACPGLREFLDGICAEDFLSADD